VPEPVAQLSGVYFGYDDTPVLEDVNVSVEAGSFVGVVGPNGGGKTTLLKLMLGLLTPMRGEVRMFGRPPVEVRHRIAYVSQSSNHDSRFPATVLDVVLMGRLGKALALGHYSRRDRELAREALSSVGLEGLTGQRLSELSGGQQQRVLIARALVTEPDLLLLDEPTASLDVLAETDLYDLLEDLNREHTIILVTHDVSFVSHCVRTVLCVNRRVVRHHTSDLGEVDGALLKAMYGSDMRLVRHDETYDGECTHG